MASFFKSNGKSKANQKDGVVKDSAQFNEGASRSTRVHGLSRSSTDAASRQSFESMAGRDTPDPAHLDTDGYAVNQTYSNSFFGGSVINRIIVNSFNTAKYSWFNSGSTAKSGAGAAGPPESAPRSTPSQSPTSTTSNADPVQRFIGNLHFGQAVDNENIGNGPAQLFEGNITFYGPVTNRNISQPANTTTYNNVPGTGGSAEASDAVRNAELQRLIRESTDQTEVEELQKQMRRP